MANTYPLTQDGQNIQKAINDALGTIPSQIADINEDITTIETELSGKAPTSSVPTKTSELDNDAGFITASDVPEQVQSDWNQDGSTAVDFIKNKPNVFSLSISSIEEIDSIENVGTYFLNDASTDIRSVLHVTSVTGKVSQFLFNAYGEITSRAKTDGVWSDWGSVLPDGSVTEEKIADEVMNTITAKANKQTLGGGFVAGEGANMLIGGTSAAIGKSAYAIMGGVALGENAYATQGGAAVGQGARAVTGFSGGKNAKSSVDAVQLGTGTNGNEKTLQVYDNQLLDADGHIPVERIADGSITDDKIDSVNSSKLMSLLTYDEIDSVFPDFAVYYSKNAEGVAYEDAPFETGTIHTIHYTDMLYNTLWVQIGIDKLGNIYNRDSVDNIWVKKSNSYTTDEKDKLANIKNNYPIVTQIGTSFDAQAVLSNKMTIFGTVTMLDVVPLISDDNETIANEAVVIFTSGATPTILLVPSECKWFGGEPIEIEANKTYMLSFIYDGTTWLVIGGEFDVDSE